MLAISIERLQVARPVAGSTREMAARDASIGNPAGSIDSHSEPRPYALPTTRVPSGVRGSATARSVPEFRSTRAREVDVIWEPWTVAVETQSDPSSPFKSPKIDWIGDNGHLMGAQVDANKACCRVDVSDNPEGVTSDCGPLDIGHRQPRENGGLDRASGSSR